jgi:hypothetical protein
MAITIGTSGEEPPSSLWDEVCVPVGCCEDDCGLDADDCFEPVSGLP